MERIDTIAEHQKGVGDIESLADIQPDAGLQRPSAVLHRAEDTSQVEELAVRLFVEIGVNQGEFGLIDEVSHGAFVEIGTAAIEIRPGGMPTAISV